MPGQERLIRLWNHFFNRWEKAPAVVTTVRLTAVGSVKGAPGKLYWIDCNPSGGDSEWALSDDLVGLGVTVLDEFHVGRESHMVTLNPPMQFVTGIYLKSENRMTAMTFGYI